MIVKPLSNEEEWEEFVASSPKGTFYHTLKWKRIVEESFLFESLYLVIRDSNDNSIGVCPFFITKKLWPFKVLDSLPGSDFGGPLIKEECKKQAAKVLSGYLKKLSSKEGITYARTRFSEEELCEYFKTEASRVATSYGTMNLDLEKKPVDLIWNEIFNRRDGQRKFIRRFERDGFQNRDASKKEDLNKFYIFYYNSMNYIGALPYPFTFFRNIWELLYPINFNIILTENKEKCIGALAFFIFRERETIYLTYLGLDREIRNKFHTSYYLYWEAIKWAQKNGFRYVNFGSTPSDPTSVYYSLKSKFGTEFNQDYVLYLPFNRKLFLLRENMIKVGRKIKNILPKKLAKKLVSKLYLNYKHNR